MTKIENFNKKYQMGKLKRTCNIKVPKCIESHDYPFALIVILSPYIYSQFYSKKKIKNKRKQNKKKEENKNKIKRKLKESKKLKKKRNKNKGDSLRS